MGEPGFWDEPDAAAKVNAEHARTTRRLATFGSLETDVEDLEGLVELAEEDPEIAGEVEDSFASVESRLEDRAEAVRRPRMVVPPVTWEVTRVR